MHTATHTASLDWLIFCLAGRWACQFKVAASICKWLHCLTLVRFCSMDQVLQMRASPGTVLPGWPSRPIPAGETGRLCSVDVSFSNLIHSSESGVSVEIIGVMTAADSGNWKTPSPRVLSMRICRLSRPFQNAGVQKRKMMFHLWPCRTAFPVQCRLTPRASLHHHACSIFSTYFVVVVLHLLLW